MMGDKEFADTSAVKPRKTPVKRQSKPQTAPEPDSPAESKKKRRKPQTAAQRRTSLANLAKARQAKKAKEG